MFTWGTERSEIALIDTSPSVVLQIVQHLWYDLLLFFQVKYQQGHLTAWQLCFIKSIPPQIGTPGRDPQVLPQPLVQAVREAEQSTALAEPPDRSP